MQYVCVHCDETFEHDAADKARCPKCMRVHAVRAVRDASGAVRKGGSAMRARLPSLMIATVAILVAAAGFFVIRGKLGSRSPAAVDEAFSPSDLAKTLTARGVSAGKLTALLTPDAAVERFAEQAARGRSGATDRARGIVLALRARAAKQAFVPWSMSDARDSAPMSAASVLAAISKDGARRELYPLELAALGVAALRSLDQPAVLCEVFARSGERAPLDPSGRLGYFEIALPQSSKGEPRFFDPYGGRPERSACDDCAVLNDVQAIGAALGISALTRVVVNDDPAAALRDADAAIKLLPTSPSVRGARGAVLLSNAALDPGSQEFEAAAQMRPDAARRANLAVLWLARGDVERAAREISKALEAQPDFAAARVTLAAVHLSQGEREQARAELDKAEALDPRLPALALTWAQYHASAGETELAISQAQRAIAQRPRDLQAHLLLGRIYRQASRFDEMRSEARIVLQLTPQTQQVRTRQLIEGLLGASALEPEVGAVESPAKARATDPGALAGDSAGQTPRLHLSDPALPSSGTLNPSGGTPKLQLQQPGGGLKLNLGH
jgi:tetratricopeptide (TPR) repeat protein